MTTETLALVGAITGVVGTVAGLAALVLNLKSYLRDTPRLKLTASMGEEFPPGKPTIPYFELTARNTGRRVIHIHRAFVRIPPFLFQGEAEKGIPMPSHVDYVIFPVGDAKPPLTLSEYQKHVFRHGPFDPGMLHHLQTGKKAEAVVEDSLGKIYVTRFWPLKPRAEKKK